MNRSPRPRKISELSEGVNHQLTLYSLAASAAGVSLLALAPPAEGKVVVTKTWVEISVFTKTYQFDLNHDGVADFTFFDYGTSSGKYAALKIAPAGQNAIWGTAKYAPALPAGVRIGPSKKFQTAKLLMAGDVAGCSSTCFSESFGPWADVTRRYLGLKFFISGQIHYGWARLNVTVAGVPYAALTEFAYETIPNKSIVTGATRANAKEIVKPGNPRFSSVTDPAHASLGALALGVTTLDIWRRRDPVQE
jgi:hypothetical protein